MRQWPVVSLLVVSLPVLLAASLLASCQETKTLSPAEQARVDTKAIAMVEAAQDLKPPPIALEPQPITATDIEANRIYGAACSLVPVTGASGDPVVVVNDRRALIKLGGKFVTFAADPGSAVLSQGARTHYVGKAQSLVLHKVPGDGTRLGDEVSRWRGTLAIRDANEQLIYSTAGELVCGA